MTSQALALRLRPRSLPLQPRLLIIDNRPQFVVQAGICILTPISRTEISICNMMGENISQSRSFEQARH